MEIPLKKAWVFHRLEQSVKLLAHPAEVQLREIPPFGRKADELYLSFDHWRMKVMGNFHSEISAEQLSCLDSMQRVFVRMGKDCWTEDAVNHSAEWKDIRDLSTKTLQKFGWSL